eukprot:CAMPEP_0179841476 /NCGR_PEP_ID=MMETSP0982-20121206/2559_1 /TAXON_ID=483367 /ORGANISM="non described non described, Strain CCMP 2436" /LENGTH=132 /DNA_ID=CAMNT_0021725575 /DNA_START=146 /DNA_END=545 /DNA_ORIENTATION=-
MGSRVLPTERLSLDSCDSQLSRTRACEARHVAVSSPGPPAGAPSNSRMPPSPQREPCLLSRSARLGWALGRSRDETQGMKVGLLGEVYGVTARDAVNGLPAANALDTTRDGIDDVVRERLANVRHCLDAREV